LAGRPRTATIESARATAVAGVAAPARLGAGIATLGLGAGDDEGIDRGDVGGAGGIARGAVDGGAAGAARGGDGGVAGSVGRGAGGGAAGAGGVGSTTGGAVTAARRSSVSVSRDWSPSRS